MFLNVSNHPWAMWSEEQKKAALQWGRIEEIPFPTVPSGASAQEIRTLAKRLVEEISLKMPEAVMCQGEFTLSYAVIRELKRRGLVVLAACTQRKTVETVLEDGKTEKRSVFQFQGFREYVELQEGNLC